MVECHIRYVKYDRTNPLWQILSENAGMARQEKVTAVFTDRTGKSGSPCHPYPFPMDTRTEFQARNTGRKRKKVHRHLSEQGRG